MQCSFAIFWIAVITFSINYGPKIFAVWRVRNFARFNLITPAVSATAERQGSAAGSADGQQSRPHRLQGSKWQLGSAHGQSRTAEQPQGLPGHNHSVRFNLCCFDGSRSLLAVDWQHAGSQSAPKVPQPARQGDAERQSRSCEPRSKRAVAVSQSRRSTKL